MGERITHTYHKGKSFWQVIPAYHNGWVQICLSSRERFRACFERQEMLEGHGVLGSLNDPQVKLVMLVKSNLRYTTLDFCVQKLPLSLVHYSFTQTGYSEPLQCCT